MPKRPPERLNTEELEQIKALRASGLTYHAVAKRIGRDAKTVKRACLQPEVANGIKAMKKKLADFFEDLAHRLLTSIKDGDIEKINVYQRVVSAGISVDKMRLLRDESTNNIGLVATIVSADRLNRQEGQKRNAVLGADKNQSEPDPPF